jgi:hypothetical protein
MSASTIHLPDELQQALSAAARAEHRSEQEILLAALGGYLARTAAALDPAPRPTVPLIEGGYGDPAAAERVDELLIGMGRLDC